MPTNIVIPEMGESVREGVIAMWRKNSGDAVKRDEPIMDLETDKITLEVVAPASGKLVIKAKVGDTVPVGAVVGLVEEGAGRDGSVGGSGSVGGAANGHRAGAGVTDSGAKDRGSGNGNAIAKDSVASSSSEVGSQGVGSSEPSSGGAAIKATPLAKKLADEHGVDISRISGTGAAGRVREQDVLMAVQSRGSGEGGTAVRDSAKNDAAPAAVGAASPTRAVAPAASGEGRGVRRERMSPLRQRIAARLVEAQHTAAMLTTFNEVDMSAVMDLRKQHKEAFEKKHGVGLGFMSFFVKGVVNALRAFPGVNASIVAAQGGGGGATEVEYHDYCDIAVAVGTPKGLVVPVLRNCERRSFAAIESGIKDLATRARDGKLTLDELQGGTFTITNGGVYGSLMSTPILNPPQSGILGMHTIKNRAVEYPNSSGQVVLRPMMYLALSYDHRIVDGAEAVQFLVTVKNGIEQPERLLLEV
ncbi:MAG: 2-oxoglutarate dehydrogenase complex dihydrolipoyllysine-residue succinyltransferase [Phycisphaerales bacterium]|nr:2-oxoglutarate dehydrogenase complex dihydrolipoyllysine-residue succinyltransferase [Phycisphaerales bacterium]